MKESAITNNHVKSICFIISAILFFSFAYLNAQDGWFWQYPKPQGNDLNDIFIFNDEAAIAVGNLGTVIKTTDGGIHWDVQHHAGGISDDLSRVYFIDSLRGWAAARRNLIKTEDGGRTWGVVSTGSQLNYSAVYFLDADTGFAVGEDGILSRTNDGGQNWDNRKIDDYIGQGWLDVFNLYAITFTDKQTGWITGAGYYGNQIYKTNDCGRTWQWCMNNVQQKIFSGLNDICFTDEMHGFITGDQGVFLRTRDGGNTWQYQNLSTKYQKDEYQFFYSTFFTDSLKGWIVGGNYYAFILKTTDGGINWTEEVNNNSEMMHHFYRIRFSNSTSRKNGWIVGQFGMIYRTTNEGDTWIPQREKNYYLNSIYFIDENYGWAVGDSGIILHTTNGGYDWERQILADSTLLSSVYAIDEQNVIAVGSIIKGLSIYNRTALLVRTTDGGLTWKKQVFDSLYGLSSITFVNDSVGWISGREVILKSIDRGNTWQSIRSNTGGTYNRIQFIDDTTGWVSSYLGNSLLKTVDGGVSWNTQLVDSGLSLYAFQFTNADYGWAVGDYNYGKNIFRTADGGIHWNPCSNTPIADFTAVSFVDGEIGWVGGYDYLDRISSLAKTTDGGTSWHIQNAPNTEGFSYIKFLNQTTGWAVGNGIFKTVDGGGIVYIKHDEISGKIFPRGICLYQNYPNPFNPSTTFKYYLSSSGHVTLRIYDVLGRVIETLIDKHQEQGEHQAKWEAINLPSGIYFFQLKAGKYSETKKMILLR